MSLNLAVLYGGTSAEREVSLNSGAAVAKGLAAQGFNVELIDTKDTQVAELANKDLDAVFIALHGRGGEDGTMQGALDLLNIKYTGSGVLGSAVCMDKVATKRIFKGANIATADFEIVSKSKFNALNSDKMLAKLGGKAMVKPAKEGSSIGMSIVTSADELNAALTLAFNYDQQALVEAWIEGPEYTVAILGDKALPSIHMETPREFYDYEAKYQSNKTEYHCPSGLSAEDEAELQALALAAFNATGAKGWGRVDVMRNQQGKWQVLEVNTSPGMTETSLVPKAAKVAGLDFGQLVTKIVAIAIDKSEA